MTMGKVIDEAGSAIALCAGLCGVYRDPTDGEVPLREEACCAFD